MSKFELWICQVGDGDDERIIYEGSNVSDMKTAAVNNSDEVLYDIDKYFMVNDMTFNTCDELLNCF